MNLIVDVGNTYTKLAVYENGNLLDKYVVHDSQSEEKLSIILNSYPKLSHCIISVVGKWNKKLENCIQQKLSVLLLNKDSKLPFKNLYKTPSTLGIDRIALASASVEQFAENNTLIIDAGTCITYDFVNKKNHYLGGAISLGLNSRYKALSEFTEKLPQLALQQIESVGLIGDDTNSSIHSGVVNGVIFELEGVISEYKKQFPDLVTILTGGDANFLAKQLKSTIFANQNFLLEGLNYILEYNKIND